MKFSLIAIGLLAIIPAFAAEQDPCQKFMPCGVYEGEGTDYESDGKNPVEFIETWKISKVNENTLHIEQAMFEKDGKREKFYDINANVVFDSEGVYSIRRKDGSLFATGVCREMACTFNFMPRKVQRDGKDIVVLNVNTFRFIEGKMQRWMMVTTGVEQPTYQTALLKKK
jgi:hypothetical protein